MGPTIQQGIIQCLVQQKSQLVTTDARLNEMIHSREAPQEQDRGNLTSDPEQNGRDRLPEDEGYPNHGDQVINSFRACKPIPLGEVARPVFVNHYYA